MAHVFLRELDDASVLALLSHLTLELRDRLANEDQAVVQSEEEATLAISSLLKASGNLIERSSGVELTLEELDFAQLGRRLLDVLLSDKTMLWVIEDYLASPPVDLQMAAELPSAKSVVLGATVAWLQTKIEVRANRSTEGTDFRFARGMRLDGGLAVEAAAQSLTALIDGNPDPMLDVSRATEATASRRDVNAWLKDVELPMRTGVEYTLKVNVGAPRDDRVGGGSFAEPTWDRGVIELLVSLSCADADITPASHIVSLGRAGDSDQATFHWKAQRDGALPFLLSIYLARELTLLSEFRFSLKVLKHEYVPERA